MVTTRQKIHELEKQHDSLINENHHTEAQELWDTQIQPLMDQFSCEEDDKAVEMDEGAVHPVTGQVEFPGDTTADREAWMSKEEAVNKMASIIRQGLVAVGISDSFYTWESLPPHRKARHLDYARALYEEGYRIVTPQEFQAIRFSASIVGDALESDSVESAEMLHAAYHQFPTEDPDGGSYRDHVEALQGLFGSEQILTSDVGV